jgi:hypothetical protein
VSEADRIICVFRESRGSRDGPPAKHSVHTYYACCPRNMYHWLTQSYSTFSLLMGDKAFQGIVNSARCEYHTATFLW